MPAAPPALVAFVSKAKPDWRKVTLNYVDFAHARRPGLCEIVPHPRPLVDLVPDPVLTELFGKSSALYQAFGRSLLSGHWRIEQDRPAKVSVETYYG